jgi:hypothetical protein
MQLARENELEPSSTPDRISRVYLYPSKDFTSTFLNVRCEADWAAVLLEDLPGQQGGSTCVLAGHFC